MIYPGTYQRFERKNLDPLGPKAAPFGAEDKHMLKTLAEIGEFGLIHRLDKLIKKEGVRAPGVAVGIGDDCAAIRPPLEKELLVTCDCVVENRHYLPDRISPLDLGRRSMVLNISDIGAMGGHPLYALISLGLRADMPAEDVEDIYRGFFMELNPLGACIVGGNVTQSEKANFLDITLIGEVNRGKMVRRSTAHEGDAILVTGYPGQSAAGLSLLERSFSEKNLQAHPIVKAYLTPTHRAREGQAVAQSGYATAMIDISDGFLGDLGHICEGSLVGAEIHKEKCPISRDLKQAARTLGKDPYDFFLGDSDDYELIITCSPGHAVDIAAVVSCVSQVPVTAVGSITSASEGMQIIFPDGSSSPVSPSGWDHFSV